MAKKQAKGPAAKASTPEGVDAEVAKKIVELKTEGNNAFARGDYTAALSTYDEAIKLLPAGAAERVDFHNNKAACFIGQKRYKEAVKECSSALEVAPASIRALQRRAKAYEQQGQLKLAIADLVAINKSDQATPETQEHERRLREAAARRPASGGHAANGAGGAVSTPRGAGAAGGAGAGAGGRNSLNNVITHGQFVAKCSLGDEARLVHLSLAHNYADVLAAVQAKFPGAGPFALKYVDKSGDLVTITSKADVHVALGDLVQAYQRQVASQGAHGPKLNAPFPPLKLLLSPVASEADVPRPPPEEELERQQLLALQRAQLAAEQRKAAEAGGAPAAAPTEEVHLDSWLVEFAHLFMQTTGLDPDKHAELHNLGWDAVQKGMDATIASDAALPLFEKAKESFRDVAATGLTSWGQVHQVLGTRLLDGAARAKTPLADVAPAALAEFAAAEAKYREALATSPDFFDAVCNLSQLEFERCKLTAGLLPTDAKPAGEASAEGAAAGKTAEQEAVEATQAAQRAVLSVLKPNDVDASRPQYEAALGWADRAIALAPGMDAKQKENKAAAEAAAAGTSAAPPAEYDYKAQALVQKGNFIYEWSQMLAAVGNDGWQPQLDAAVALFREAGCPEKDIRGALRNHFKASELNVPPEEEAEPAKAEPAKAEPAKPEPAKAEPAEEKPKAKGLPSLEVKKAKK